VQYQQRYLRLIAALASTRSVGPADDLLDRDHRGRVVPRVNLSLKLSSLFSQFDPIDPEGTTAAVRARLRPILRLARETGTFVNIDMEQHAYKDATLRIFRDVLEDRTFATGRTSALRFRPI
jgi:RHH-type proline utilization regulon transcriptional repressor/proline dehydrogenase/delta 1-pyrroline-5-carboxylate dehydrogenase